MGKYVRYQALDKKGNVLKTGNRLQDVLGMGTWVVIDYKMNRYAIQPIYPPTVQDWRKLTAKIKSGMADLFRKG